MPKMNDWLSKLDSKRRADVIAEQERTAWELAVTNNIQEGRRQSYERNRARIEFIYKALEDYASRARGMGFEVNTVRHETYGFAVVGRHKFPDEGGYSTHEARLELIPFGDSFDIHYNGRVSPTNKTSVSLRRVNEKIIANWVRWSVGEGPGNPIEERWFRIILIGCLLAIIIPIFCAAVFAIVSRF
jgi:hypothetical protein